MGQNDLSLPLPETHLFPLISYPLGLPDLVIQIDDKVFHESPFHIGSETGPMIIKSLLTRIKRGVPCTVGWLFLQLYPLPPITDYLE